MVQFHLGENSISFSDDFNKLNTLRTDIIDDMSQFSIYDSMEQLISKHGKMPNVDEVASSFPLMVNQLICEAIVPIIVNFLVENEIYDCSEELFIHRYQERYFNFAKQPQFQNFLSHYVNLANEYMEKRTQKAYNRANRSQWMGGGFGITGAIKGAAQAAVLNAATGVVRGIGDGISDFASSTAYKSKQNSLLSDDVFQEFDIALQNCIHGCILACQIEYSTHKGILCSWSQRENIEKSFAIFNNVQTRVTDTSKIARLMSTAIELSPYNEEYYSFLYRQDGIDKTEVLALAEYLGFSLYADRLELMDTALDALLDQLSSPAQYGECAKGIIALGQKYSLISSDDCIHATVKGDEAAGTLIKSSFEFAVHGLYHEAMEQSRAGNNSAEQHRIYLQSLEDLKKRYDYPNLPELDPSAINEIQELENASDLRVAAEVQQQQYEGDDCSTITMLVVHHRFVASGDGYIYYGFKTCRDTQTTGLEFKDDAYIEYDGGLKENQKNGQGKEYIFNYSKNVPSLIYEGGFKDDKTSGKGKGYYEGGSLYYDGEYKNGKRNGKGTLYNEDGSVQYKGNFKDGNAA